MDSNSPVESSDASEQSCNDESAVEVWEGNEGEYSDSESESSEIGTHTQLHFMVIIFVSFFQLCFRVSDRAIIHLLSFMSAWKSDTYVKYRLVPAV